MNGKGFGPGGKFFGRRLAQAYGATATINAARMATTREATEIARFVVHGCPVVDGVKDIFPRLGCFLQRGQTRLGLGEAERLMAPSKTPATSAPRRFLSVCTQFREEQINDSLPIKPMK